MTWERTITWVHSTKWKSYVTAVQKFQTEKQINSEKKKKMGCNTSQEQKSSINEGDDAAGAEEKNQENHTTEEDKNDKKSGKRSAKSLKSEKDNGHIDANASKKEGEIIFNVDYIHVKYIHITFKLWFTDTVYVCIYTSVNEVTAKHSLCLKCPTSFTFVLLFKSIWQSFGLIRLYVRVYDVDEAGECYVYVCEKQKRIHSNLKKMISIRHTTHVGCCY